MSTYVRDVTADGIALLHVSRLDGGVHDVDGLSVQGKLGIKFELNITL